MIWDKKKRIPHFCNDFKWECFARSCTLKMEKKSPALYLRKLAVHWLMGSAELLSLLSLSCGPPSFCLSLLTGAVALGNIPYAVASRGQTEMEGEVNALGFLCL